MSAPKLTDFKVLVFDVYGTLADWETGLFTALKPLLAKYRAASWSRAEALIAFESVEKEIQTAEPTLLYADVLAKAHEALEKRLDALYERSDGTSSIESVSTTQSTSKATALDDIHVAFGKSIKDWPIFTDSSQALHDLSKHYQLVVLSNVDRESFAHTHAKLSTGDPKAYASALYSAPIGEGFWFPRRVPGSDSPFSLVMTAQDVHSYKPHPQGFSLTLDVIRKDLLDGENPQDKVLWVAQSLYHDIEPTHKLGIRSTWINRQGASMGSDEGNQKYSWTFGTLAEMADAVRSESSV